MSALMERPTVAQDFASGRYIEKVTSVASVVDRLMTIYEGSHHGYYEVLADCGPLTYVDLASHAGMTESAAREWLEPRWRSAYWWPMFAWSRHGSDATDCLPTARRFC